MPVAEMHVHLEGTISAELVRQLAARNGASDHLPADCPWSPGHRWRSYYDWRRSMRQVGDACLRTPADYAAVAREYLAMLGRQRGIYAEVAVSSSRVRRMGMDLDAVLEAVLGAIVNAPGAVSASVLVAVAVEAGGPATAADVAVARRWRDHGVVGIDAHGPPGSDLGALADAFALAHHYGLGCRVHAGEADGPDSVWQAIMALRADRIAHGVRAIEDPRLMEHLAAAGIALDLCLSSNVALGVAPTLAAHPVRALFDAGVPITLGSDDPLYFATSAAREYSLAACVHGFEDAELLAVTETAIRHSFAPPGTKAALLATVATNSPEQAA